MVPCVPSATSLPLPPRQEAKDALGLDTIQHRARRLADGHRVAVERVPKWCADGARAREEPVGRGEGAVLVGREECAAGVAREVLEGLGVLCVVHLRVEPTQDGADGGVQGEVGE